MSMMNGATWSHEARRLRSKEANEIRESWQAKLLSVARGRTAAAALVILAYSYYEAMDILCRVVWPGFIKLKPPLLSGPGKIVGTGQVVCDMVDAAGYITRNVAVYESEDELKSEFRRIADALALEDEQRTEMFDAIKRWVAADYRIAPNVEYAGNA